MTIATIERADGASLAVALPLRARNIWVSDTRSRSTIHGSFAPTADPPDDPPVAGGGQPSPVEYLLHAIAACITAGVGDLAAAEGIEVHRIVSTVAADVDLLDAPGADDPVRKGYRRIDMRVNIEGDTDADHLRRLVERSVERSAVHDLLTNGTTVSVAVAP